MTDRTVLYLPEGEAAALVRLSRRTLQRMRRTGAGPDYCKVGKRVLYARDTLLAWIERHRCASTAEADRRAAAA
ncbi:MAG: helix-turn-helix domain-containing protein [Geminicoccaceae bacterium]|nr:helix-turn-helix domain-containing protein [Geminicoccaceae bacterium]